MPKVSSKANQRVGTRRTDEGIGGRESLLAARANCLRICTYPAGFAAVPRVCLEAQSLRTGSRARGAERLLLAVVVPEVLDVLFEFVESLGNLFPCRVTDIFCLVCDTLYVPRTRSTMSPLLSESDITVYTLCSARINFFCHTWPVGVLCRRIVIPDLLTGQQVDSTPVISNRAPPASPSVTRISQPWASVTCSTILSPKPVPSRPGE